MSIKDQVRIIQRVEKNVTELQHRYASNHLATLELHKLDTSLQKLTTYLNDLDQLKPNYSTNEIDTHIDAINLHLDILKVELEKKDYTRLDHGIKIIRTVLKFHPIKYSYFTFLAAWLYEMLYFI